MGVNFKFNTGGFAEGSSTATGNYSHAEGFGSIASGQASHAEGAKYESNRNTESAGQASHAEGASTYAKADGSHAEGILNVAGRFLNEISTAAQELGISGTPEELGAKLLGYGAHVEGMNNNALGSCSHAEGQATNALANSTHAEGDTTLAFGESSHAEGYNTQARGNQSHAEGSSTIASGNSSHAEGVSTTASGSFSHAEGSHTEATGRDSHAEGVYNKANGIASHAEGVNNTAPNEAQHVSGKYATIDNTGTAIFQVGIGNDTGDRKDALRIKTDGDIIIRQDNQEIVLQDKLESLQKQIDGEISSWFFEGEPTTSNVPANEWTTDDLKQRHEGDTYTNIENAILLDSSMWEQGGIVCNTDASASGADQASEYFVRTAYINVEGCSQLLRLGSDYYYTIFYYDSNKTCLKVDSVTAKDLTITTYLQILKTVSNKNVAYFRLRLGYQNGEAQNLKFNVGNAVDAKAMINPTAGQSWRWCNIDDKYGTGWYWHKIADSDAVKALTIANGVREDFDNLEIGGVNLLPNTRTGVGFTFQPLPNTGSSGEFDSTNKWFKFTCPQNVGTNNLTDTILLKSPTVLLTPGTYTVSCLYRCTLPLNRMQVWCLPVTSEGSYDMNTLSFAFEVKSSSPVTYFQKYSATFNISEDLRDVYGWIIRIDLDHRGSHGNSQELYVKDIKLEKGHKATDWTPTLYEITPDLSGYLRLAGGTMQGNINFKTERNTIYGDADTLHLDANSTINLHALETHTCSILPQISDANIGSSSKAFNGIYANSFIKPGSNNNYVLLAGGGTKALSDLPGYLRLTGGTMTGAIDFDWNGLDIHNMLTWRKQGILLLDETDLSKLYLGTAAQLPLTVHELTTNGNILPSTSAPVIGGQVAIQPGEPRPTYISLGSTDAYFNKVYARLFKGLADNALKLYTYGTGIQQKLTPYAINEGDASTPVYFNNGVPVACNSIPTSDTVASWGYVTSSGITQLNVGNGLQGKTNNDDPVDAITTSGTISLKTASDSDIGGIKLGYSENGKNYPVEISTDKKAYVNVPWTNTDSKVTQSRSTSDGLYPLLCKLNTDNNSTTNSVNFVSGVTVNPSTGAVNAAAFYETSDIRKKEIKSDLSLDKCYDLIDKCQTVIYSLKDQTKELVGMIAQEIEEFFPEVVATDEEGFKSLAYDRLVVICFKVLKDVIKRLEKLETK